jgi:hypothetical protein
MLDKAKLKLNSASLFELALGLSLAIQTTGKIKGVAKKAWCFEFCNFDLHFLKENDIYLFLCLRI